MKKTKKSNLKRAAAAAFVLAGIAALAAAAPAMEYAPQTAGEKLPGRWYSQEMVAQGRAVYEKNCLQCHGPNAQGAAADWRKKQENGAYPPPPLNGTAHAWHHTLAQLSRTIRDGTAALGGQMPPFGDALSDAEIAAVIAYLQSLWPEEIYRVWREKAHKH